MRDYLAEDLYPELRDDPSRVARLVAKLKERLGDERPDFIPHSLVADAAEAVGVAPAGAEGQERWPRDLGTALRQIGYDRDAMLPENDRRSRGLFPLGETAYKRRNPPIGRRKDRAREALASMLPRAIRGLRRAMSAATECPQCGGFADPKQAAVVVKAAQVVLDRTGYGPSSKIEVEQPLPDWARYLTDEETATVMRLFNAAKERARVASARDVTPRRAE